MLSDEEWKAIDNMKSLLLYSKEHEYFSPFQEQEIDDMNIVLNIVEKQQKEIEELKDDSKEYQIGFAQGCYEKDLDWQDKIKAKIEEIDKEEKEKLKGTKGQDRYAIKQEYMHKRNVLQSLLEEKE